MGMRCAVKLLLALAVAGCSTGQPPSPDSLNSASRYAALGNADAGREIVERLGCGSCHVIPGVRDANGLVGPSLIHMRTRATIAGSLTNTPEELVRWLLSPQSIRPGNAMPDLALSRSDAGDIAA